MKSTIAEELQSLVSWSVSLLGDAIKIEYGEEIFSIIEKLRRQMKSTRKKDALAVHKILKKELTKFTQYTSKDLHQICNSFTLMLELINRCETAYRTYKLDAKEYSFPKKKPYAIIFVLTAHPTEARSPELLGLFEKIQDLLKKVLYEGKEKYQLELEHYLLIALKISLARSAKPTIADEARNIYSFILEDHIIDSLVYLQQNDINVSLRTWVGGDKDGHPGVDEKAMKESLGQSRAKLCSYVRRKILQVKKQIEYIPEKKLEKLNSELDYLLYLLQQLEKLKFNDGQKIKAFRSRFEKFTSLYTKNIGVCAPELISIKSVLWIFPALVVALEVREDSKVVAEALASKQNYAISKMLSYLREISKGFESKWYVRGFVLSMVQSHEDVSNGYRLAKKILKGYTIPVVPLFENEVALTNSTQIIKNYFSKHPQVIKTHIDKWGGRFEVMVGYSDSSKENGVISSRIMISSALNKIERTLKQFKLVPVYFHGSGGSLERGGGSIKEQTSWWPKSAISTYKATVQGEMVARNFGTPQILTKQVSVILDQLAQYNYDNQKHSNELMKLSGIARQTYSEMIKDSEFLKVIQLATPYSFLHHLKIGSRPSKRSSGSIEKNLRAIPWILCWTQTRTLFPTWWGIGSAWSQLSSIEKKNIKNEFKSNNVLSSYVKALGFTLAKIELGVWKLYLDNSGLETKSKKIVFDQFFTEYQLAQKFFSEITGNKEALWFRPWLQESIDLRSSMIHPLNLCQIESLRRGDIELLRKSVTGIACGMLTTG